MAYLVSSQLVEIEAIAATTTVDLLPHVTNDLLLIAVAQDNATGFSATGWTAIGTFAASGGSGMQFFYKVAASGSETNPTFSGANDDWITWMGVIRDADPVSPIDVSNRTDFNNVDSYTSGTPSTATNGCLVIYGSCNDSNAQQFTGPDMIPLGAGNSNNAIGLVVSAYNQLTAGAISAKRFYVDQGDEGGNCWTIAIKNKASGSLGPNAASPYTLVDMYNVNTGRTFVSPSTEFTTINGQNCDTTVTTSTVQQISDPGDWTGWVTFASAASSLDWAGAVHQLGAAVDMSNGIVKIPWRITSTAQTGTKGAIVAFKDGSGNWAAYTLSQRSGLAIQPVYYVNHIAVGQSTPLDSSGSIDWTNITKIGYFYQRNNSATSANLQIGPVQLFRPTHYYTGGSAASPLTLEHVGVMSLGQRRAFYDAVNLQGRGQLIAKHHITFGDGSTPTYLDMSFNSLETLAAYNYVAGRRWWNVIDGVLQMTVNACATCTMLFNNCALAPQVRSTFTVASTSSTSATYSFQGSLWSNWDWVAKTGVAVNGATFSRCYEIDAKAASFTNCNILNSRSANAAMKVEGGASITNCAFSTSTSSDYAIRVPSSVSGDITITLDGTTFTGFTTPINVQKTTGTVTIHLSLGQTQPAYISAGATVVFDQPTVSATASVSGLIAGSRIRIYNVTTATEKVNAVQAGTPYTLTYSDGTEYTSGDIVKVRVIGPVGATAYEDQEYTAVATSGGWSVLVDPVADSVYNTLAIDGSAVTGFAADYVNDEVNITVGSNFNVSDLYAWWKYNLSTSQGISDFFGGLTAVDLANFRINNDKVDIYLDNTTATNIRQLDNRRIYRTDEAYPVKSSGGGGIDVVWRNTILIATVGGGPLTSEQATKLMSLDTTNLDMPVSDVPGLVWDEVLTKATHNIANSAGVKLRHVASPIIHDGTAQAGTANTITLSASASSINGAYDPAVVTIVAGTGAGQSAIVLQYNGTTKVATVHRDWRVVPDNTSDYIIQAHGEIVSVNEGNAQGGTPTSITLNANASSTDGVYVGQLVFLVSGTGQDQCGMVTAYNGTTKVATIEVGNGGGWRVTPDATTAYVMMPSSPVLLSTSDSTSTAVSLIKAKTDAITVTSGLVEVDVQKMNNAEVIGTGVAGDAWRGVGVSP